ncbi:hypothetical protein ACFX13_027863 [Malus domestica]
MVSLPPNEKVILVGHSLGGAVISIFMEWFPHKIVAAVYVTAFMYGPTLNFSTTYAEVMNFIYTKSVNVPLYIVKPQYVNV